MKLQGIVSLILSCISCTLIAHTMSHNNWFITTGMGLDLYHSKQTDTHDYFAAKNLTSNLSFNQTQPLIKVDFGRAWPIATNKYLSVSLELASPLGPKISKNSYDQFFLKGQTFYTEHTDFISSANLNYIYAMTRRQAISGTIGFALRYNSETLGYNVGGRSPFDPRYPGFYLSYHQLVPGIKLGLSDHIRFGKHQLVVGAGYITYFSRTYHKTLAAYPDPTTPSSVPHTIHTSSHAFELSIGINQA